MRELATAIVDELSTKALEGIIEFGEYGKLHGFRKGGKNTVIKRNLLKSMLIKNENKFFDATKKYAEKQVMDKKIDNIWTFQDEIPSNTLNEKVQYGNTQKIILELMSNDRLDVLKELFIESEEKIDDLKENKKSDDTNDKTVKNLRKIIKNLEEDKQQLEKNKNILQEKNEQLNNQLKISREKNNEDKQTIKEYKKELKEYVTAYDKKNLEIKRMDEVLSNRVLEVKRLKKKLNTIFIIVIGAKQSEEWFDYHNSRDRYHFIYKNVNDLQICSVTEKIHELWIIRSHLNRTDMDNLIKTELYKLFYSIDRVKIFEEFKTIQDYMIKLEEVL